MNAEQFCALRLVSAILLPIITLLCMAALNNDNMIWVVASIFLGYFFPVIWLADTRKKRRIAVIKTLPVYLDFITMSVEAGLNLQGALGQAIEKAPPGPLRNEFRIVIRDLRSGLPRSEALRRMANRLDITEITSFVGAMDRRSEKMGSSLAAVLRIQSEQRRSERFLRVEKIAMEAPVKLVAPLVIFIFPVTFIILGFPIAMKFLNEGSLQSPAYRTAVWFQANTITASCRRRCVQQPCSNACEDCYGARYCHHSRRC
ncbi:MAG: type II secretion system F family protein [Gammaproteobacteria bacterium]|nr:type II secretion system F family protein [Gammaproteobacteria bacterium]